MRTQEEHNMCHCSSNLVEGEADCHVTMNRKHPGFRTWAVLQDAPLKHAPMNYYKYGQWHRHD